MQKIKYSVRLLVVVLLVGLFAGVSVHAAEPEDLRLYPGGMPFGVRVQTKGVLVVGLSKVACADSVEEPAARAGLCAKDMILAINDTPVHTVEEVTTRIEASGGAALRLTVLRGERELTLHLTPARAKADGKYRAGVWIRDSAAGIGTVSFIFPETGMFAGLGHGICDSDTGELMPLARGMVTDVSIVGVHKGKSGHPGELRGVFCAGKKGTLLANTTTGVYGVYSQIPETVPVSEPMAVLPAESLTEGDAQIYCTVGERMDKYDVRISRINPHAESKNFVVEVTDPRLLELTGGIVQGMSGSPVIRDGKLIGAVTHVLINDPTRGYGITVASMLKNMETLG